MEPPEVDIRQLRELLDDYESALHFLDRVHSEHLVTGIPFFDAAPSRPLRPGNIVELSGPSGSAKSELLLQVAASALLHAVSSLQRISLQSSGSLGPPPPGPLSTLGGGTSTPPYGEIHSPALHTQSLQKPSLHEPAEGEREGEGTSRMKWEVFLLDLDLKFDAWRLKAILQDRVQNLPSHELLPPEEDSIVLECLKSLTVIRCQSSLHFIAALKAVEARLQKASPEPPRAVPLILLDSVGTFYWAERAILRDPVQSSGFGAALPLSVSADVVARELQGMALRHRALVVASKTLLFLSGPHHRTTLPSEPALLPGALSGAQADDDEGGEDRWGALCWRQLPQWREHMPRAWQAAVTHRAQVRRLPPRTDVREPAFMAQWEGLSGQHEAAPVCMSIHRGIMSVLHGPNVTG